MNLISIGKRLSFAKLSSGKNTRSRVLLKSIIMEQRRIFIYAHYHHFMGYIFLARDAESNITIYYFIGFVLCVFIKIKVNAVPQIYRIFVGSCAFFILKLK